MSWNVTTQLFDYMDKVTTDMVSQNVGVVISTITPLIGIGLAISLMVGGLYSMVTGGGEPLSELMGKFFRYTIICGIAGAGGLYQTDLAKVAMKAPDEFAQVLVLPGAIKDDSSMASMIDKTADKGMEIAKTAFENGGITSGGLASYGLGVATVILTVVMCGVGTALIMMAKFMLAITVCFGPIFIYCLLFKPLTGLFDKWIGSVINFGLLTILLSIAFGLFMGFFEKAISAAALPDASLLVPISAAGLITLVGWFAMKAMPELASSWGSGVSATYRNFRSPGQPSAGNGGGGANKGSGSGGSPAQEAGGNAAGAAAGAVAGGPAGAAAGSSGMKGFARRA